MEKIETRVVKPELSFFENDINYTILTPETELLLDSKVKDIENYMISNNGKGKSEEEKNSIYHEAQNIWHVFVNVLKEAKYNFYLNRIQYKFLTDLIVSKMEYDVNTVFFAIELTDMLGNMKKESSRFTNDKDLFSFPVNATEITYIYHLISKHKVKGLTKDAYTFAEILYRIGGISKIFAYYEEISKSLSKDIQTWVLTFDEGVFYDKIEESSPTSEVV